MMRNDREKRKDSEILRKGGGRMYVKNQYINLRTPVASPLSSVSRANAISIARVRTVNE